MLSDSWRYVVMAEVYCSGVPLISEGGMPLTTPNATSREPTMRPRPTYGTMGV